MYGYERSYKTGRAVTSWVEFIGWVIVFLGVIVALEGLSSGGFMGMASRNFGGGSTPFILRIVSMVPGILVAAGGLMSIMLAQHTKATIDTSEMTRELLAIARGEPQKTNPSSIGPQTASQAASTISSGTETDNSQSANNTADFDANGERIYRGMTIKKIDNKYHVGQRSFSTLGQAKKFILDHA